ncbi:MAG: glycosyltransferase [Bacteroidota bacterium]
MYCLATRKPLWIWWGGTVYTERNVSPLKKILRNFFKEYPKWISYGKTSTDYLLSIGIKRSRILQVQNTINEQLFFNNKSFVWLNYPAPKILFVGELVQRKGLDLLLNSISRLRKNGYQFSLIIIGEGPEKSRYQSIVANHQLKQVYFLGSIPSHKVPKYYNAVDFMVFPTLHDVWGLVVNEALWSNLPVLSSKYAGASEELLEPTYIFDPLDAKDFDIKMQMMHNTYKEFTTDFDKLINIEDVGKMIASELKSD